MLRTGGLAPPGAHVDARCRRVVFGMRVERGESAFESSHRRFERYDACFESAFVAFRLVHSARAYSVPGLRSHRSRILEVGKDIRCVGSKMGVRMPFRSAARLRATREHRFA